jgi:two-component system phosphate regulon response regulator PhoB
VNHLSKDASAGGAAPLVTPPVGLPQYANARQSVPPRILLVAAGQEGEALADDLAECGFDVSAASGVASRERCQFHRRPHLVLYRQGSFMRESGSGWRDCAAAGAPIAPGLVYLVDEASEEERIAALEGGVDDIVVLPFSLRELAARLRAVIRRSHPAACRSVLTFGDLVLDPAAGRATRAGEPLRLSRKELQFLQVFMEHPHQVLSRQQLIDAVWGPRRIVEARTIDVHIRRLRVGLRDQRFELLRTIRHIGYRLGQELEDAARLEPPQR